MLNSSANTRWKVGLFTLGTLLFLGYLSVYVNNHPYWWRPCELITVKVEDATGLKTKTPVKTLGLDIGYVKEVGLLGSQVLIKICITAPVEVDAKNSHAYLRQEGFLGDKFLEIKPVKYLGDQEQIETPSVQGVGAPEQASPTRPGAHSAISSPWTKKVVSQKRGSTPLAFRAASRVLAVAVQFLDRVVPSAFADQPKTSVPGKSASGTEVTVGEKSTDVQQMMNQMSGLVNEVKSISTSLKDSINPEEIRNTVKQLNKTLENASKIISPEGSLSSTAQRSLLKLEDAIDQLRDQMTKINQGQGSLGKLLNDPVYAEELQQALVNMNKLLNRANQMRLVVDLGLQELPAISGTRGFFELTIWPKSDHYYLVGLTSDPRGSITQTVTTTTVGTQSTTVSSTQVTKGGFGLTGQIGKVFFQRYDLSLGMLYGDGAARLKINLGPKENLSMVQWQSDLYFRGASTNGNWTVQADVRTYLIYQPISIFYVSAGVEGFRQAGGSFQYLAGAGIRFDDEDIKLLLSLK